MSKPSSRGLKLRELRRMRHSNLRAVPPTAERPLPSSVETERVILGVVLLDNATLPQVLEHLRRDDFYVDAHRRILNRMIALFEKGIPVDPITLREELSRSGELEQVGGPSYLAGLIDGVPQLRNLEHYVKIVSEKSKIRRLLSISSQITADCFEQQDNSAEIVDAAVEALADVGGAPRNGHGRAAMQLESATESMMRAASDAQVAPAWEGLLNAGDLAIVTGLPGSGKTILAANLGLTVAIRAPEYLGRAVEISGPVVYVNVDMPAKRFRKRLAMMCAALPFPPSAGRLDQFHSTTTSLRLLAAGDFRMLSAALARVRPALFVIDALGFLHTADESQSHEIVPVLERLKDLRNTFEMTVLVLAHDRKDGRTLLGSVMKAAVADTILRCRELPESDGLRFTIGHGDKVRDMARVRPFRVRLDARTYWLSLEESPKGAGGRPPKVQTVDVEAILAAGPIRGQAVLVERLKARTGCGERQAQAVIARGRELGLIHVDDSTGRDQPRIYTLAKVEVRKRPF